MVVGSQGNQADAVQQAVVRRWPRGAIADVWLLDLWGSGREDSEQSCGP